MNKTVLTIFSSVFVLIAGLPSCSPDLRKTSPFHAPVPRIHRADGALDLKAWDQSTRHELDLEDAIDISEARAVRSETRLRCQLDDRSYYKESAQSSPHEIKVMEIVPENLLTADLETRSVLCSADLILTNSENSRHIFSLTNFRMRGRSPSRIELEQNGKNETHRLTLEFSAVNAVRARFRNLSPAKAQVHCASRTFDEITFDRVIDLTDFDFSRPHLLGDLQPDVKELCRVEVRENGRLSSLSPLFFFWRAPHLKIAIDQEFKITEDIKKALFIFRTLELRRFRLTNAETRALSFSFPSFFEEEIDTYYTRKVVSVDKRGLRAEFKIAHLKNAESHVDRDLTYVTVQPGGEVTILLVAHPHDLQIGCGSAPLSLLGATFRLERPQNLKFSSDGIPDQAMPLGDAVSVVFNWPFRMDNASPLRCPL